MFLYLFSTITVLKHMSLKENKVQFRKNKCVNFLLIILPSREIKDDTFVSIVQRIHNNNIQKGLLLSIGPKRY